MTSFALPEYSLFDSLQYRGKTSYAETLDWLSLPVRTLFQGRKLDVQSATYQEGAFSRVSLITAFALTVFCVPVVMVGFACLLLKSITCYKHEKMLFNQTCTLLQKVAQTSDSDEKVNVLKNNPGLISNQIGLEALKRECERLIGLGNPFAESVQQLLQLLPTAETIKFIDDALSRKIAAEGIVDVELIVNFVQKSLTELEQTNLRDSLFYLATHSLAIQRQGPLHVQLYKLHVLEKISDLFKMTDMLEFFNSYLRNIDPDLQDLSEEKLRALLSNLAGGFNDYFQEKGELREKAKPFENFDTSACGANWRAQLVKDHELFFDCFLKYFDKLSHSNFQWARRDEFPDIIQRLNTSIHNANSDSFMHVVKSHVITNIDLWNKFSLDNYKFFKRKLEINEELISIELKQIMYWENWKLVIDNLLLILWNIQGSPQVAQEAALPEEPPQQDSAPESTGISRENETLAFFAGLAGEP